MEIFDSYDHQALFQTPPLLGARSYSLVAYSRDTGRIFYIDVSGESATVSPIRAQPVALAASSGPMVFFDADGVWQIGITNVAQPGGRPYLVQKKRECEPCSY